MQLLQKDKYFSEHANNDTIIYRNLLAFTENIQKVLFPYPITLITTNMLIACYNVCSYVQQFYKTINVYIQYVCRY